MELKDFIKNTLLDIAAAMKETNEDKTTNMIVNPSTMFKAESNAPYTTNSVADKNGLRYIQKIQFDVAVTSSGAIQGKAGAGINVVGVQIGGGGEVKDEHSNVSHIKFEIPVALPNG